MIIPIRCTSCSKVLADKWLWYVKKCKDKEEDKDESSSSHEGNEKKKIYFDKQMTGPILDELGLTRYCCRRVFLSHVDLIDSI